MLLHDKLRHWVAKTPERCAIRHGGTVLNYAEIWSAISGFTAWLLSNIKKGSRVLISLENRPEIVYSLYAIPVAGLIVVPIDANMHHRNLSYILADCDAEIIVTSNKQLQKIYNILDKSKVKIIILVDADAERHKDEIIILPFKGIIGSVDKKTDVNVAGTDIAAILYTTGTTGPKKGVMLSHFNLISATSNINQFMRLSDGVIESLPMPLSHSFGFARLRAVFDVGGTVILENGLLRPEKLLFNMQKYKVNAFAAVPAAFEILLNEYYGPEFKKIAPQLEYIEIGSAFMRLEHKKILMEYCPKARICMHYGLTEASRSTFIEFRSQKDKLQTVGQQSPNVSVKIVNEEGKNLFNAVGEIVIKGDMVMQGYWNKEKLTNRVLKDNWFFSGDLGLIDDDAYLHFVGRKEEVINIGGFKVGPEEIEAVLLKYEGIAEAAVVGQNSIKAYIVTKNISQGFDLRNLKKFCLSQLEPYKVPEEFILIRSLPKTISGKIQKYLLMEKENG